MITRRDFVKLGVTTAALLALPEVINQRYGKASGPLKCVAGWPTWPLVQSVGAHFGYQWDNADPAHGRIPNLKGEDEFQRPWTGEAAIRTAARSGSVMVGNEWTLKDWDTTKQATLLKYFCDIALDENPNCYILGTNDIAWCPQRGWDGYHRIEAVANRYAQLYGSVPPLKGVGFHAYHWPGGAKLENVIWWSAEEARRVYGNVDVHLTETGSLVGEEHALASMPKIQEGLGANIAAWFWFVSHTVPGCSVWDSRWNLTRVGRAFKRM